MYNVKSIQTKVEHILAEYMNFSDIDAMKKYINQRFILGYKELLWQTIFEIYYDNYCKYCKREPIASMFKDQGDNKEETEVDMELASNKDYKKTQRTYRIFRKHNDNLSIENNNGKDVEYVELKKHADKFKGHRIKIYQQNQLLNLNEFKIFKYIVEERIEDSKSISNIELRKALEDIDKIYDRINKTFSNYFERSVQYYQFELSCRLETRYLIAYAISKVNISLEEKIKDIDSFKAFWGVSCYGNRLQNKIMLGIKKYINKFIESPEVIELIPIEIYELNLVKYHIRKSILKDLENENIRLDFEECNDFFRGFFGEMQHVNKDKKWDNKLLMNFRRTYKN